jgi:hypothetical protein
MSCLAAQNPAVILNEGPLQQDAAEGPAVAFLDATSFLTWLPHISILRCGKALTSLTTT